MAGRGDIRHLLELLDLLTSLDVTCVVALHDLNLAARYCGHLVLLRNGQVVVAGVPDRVLTPEVIDRVPTPELIRSVHGVEVLVDREPATETLRITCLATATGTAAVRATRLDPGQGATARGSTSHPR
ncbi:hypothetical protein [Streptomyces sp. NPDC059247]|uniref:hypothetical protein n=1 Tax=Streptomyces sp. NPDC059247 TaxID=3346790 RepID=UPI00368D6C6E